MSSSLNISNNRIDYFNDIYLLQSTGQSSVYDVFATKTTLSNLGAINTANLSEITSALAGVATLNSALATKATITSLSNLATDVDDTQRALTPIISSTIPTIFTNLNNLNITVNSTIASLSNFYNKSYIDNKFGMQDITLTAYGNTLTYHNNTLGSIITDATINSKLSNYATITNTSNLSTDLALKAPLNNASFTGNIGINLRNNIDTLDSALFVRGQRVANPQSQGIRMGWTNSLLGFGQSYGIEICSDYDNVSTLDFCSPTSYYNGRIMFDNNQGTLSFYANTSNSTTESAAFATKQMSLNSAGKLVVQSLLEVPSIFLNGTYLLTTLSNFSDSITNINTTTSSNVALLNNLNTTVGSLITSNTLTSNLTNYVSNSSFTAASLVSSSTLANYSFNSITSNSLFMNGAIRGITSLSLISNTTDGVNLTCSGTSSIFNVNNSQINCNRNVFVSDSVNGGTLSMTVRNTSTGNSLLSLQTNNGTNNGKMFVTSDGSMTFESPGSSFSFNKNLFVSNSLPGGDVSLTLRNTASGLTSLYLQTQNTTNITRLYNDATGVFRLTQNGVVSCQAQSNGVFQVMNNNSFNKMLVMQEQDSTETPLTATNFYGFGINSNTLRYQVPALTHNHRFFCGTTQSYLITNGAGSSGSDARWKTEIQDITDGLEKVKQLQGKTFVYNNCIGRQMGLIAQDVKPIVPEVVIEDDAGYNFLCYDRLVALLIESVKELEQRVEILENK